MADNREQGLDADILQCRLDILRIRQSIINSRTAEAAAQEPKAADTAAGIQAELETASVPPQPEPIAAVPEPATEENPYAVTPDEINALLNHPETESEEETVESVPQPEAADNMEALFGDEVVVPVEEAQIPEPISKEDFSGEVRTESIVEALPVSNEILDVAAGGEVPLSPQPQEEPVVEEIVEPPVPEYPAPAEEISEIIAEAEEWMARVAPEETQASVNAEPELPQETPSVVSEEQLSVQEPIVQHEPAAEQPQQNDQPAESETEIVTPVLEGRSGADVFDEVVCQLQGEEHIAPVDEETQPAQPQETAELVAEEKPIAEDVKLRIIQDMKDSSGRTEQERAGVPRFDLAESDLAGIVEGRRTAAASRKAPSRRERVESQPEPASVLPLAEPQVSSVADRRAEQSKIPLEVQVSQAERRLIEKEKQLIARIVARDIERLCAMARAKETGKAGRR